MDTASDLKKMIDFINYEAQQKIDELKIIAQEEYNIEKAKHLAALKKDLSTLFASRRNELKIDYMSRVSAVKNKYKMEYLREKDALLEHFFGMVCDKLAKCPLKPSLVKFQNSGRNSRPGYNNDFDNLFQTDPRDPTVLPIFHVKPRDVSVVRSVCPNSVIRPLNDNFIGGIVIVDKDNTILVDNTYLTRLNVFKERYLGMIYKELFGE